MATIPLTNTLNNPFKACSVDCFVSILMNFFYPFRLVDRSMRMCLVIYFIDFSLVVYFAHFSLVVYFHLVFGDFSIQPTPKRLG
jgi:hypothetical protein